MKSKKLTLSIIVIIAIAVLAIALYLINKEGANQSQNNLQLINQAFPKPPDVLHSLSGTVIGIYGGTIDIQVKDLNDYLPHVDGSLQKTQILFANLSSETKIFTFDYTQRDAQGAPVEVPVKLSSIKNGEIVRVTSLENIRNAQKFDVTEVEVIR